MEYIEKEDRKILQARETQVVEFHATPDFYLRVSNGATLEFNGTVIHSFGARVDAPRRPLTALPAEDLPTLLSATPLSWVVFNSGTQRITLKHGTKNKAWPGPNMAAEWRRWPHAHLSTSIGKVGDASG